MELLALFGACFVGEGKDGVDLPHYPCTGDLAFEDSGRSIGEHSERRLWGGVRDGFRAEPTEAEEHGSHGEQRDTRGFADREKAQGRIKKRRQEEQPGGRPEKARDKDAAGKEDG